MSSRRKDYAEVDQVKRLKSEIQSLKDIKSSIEGDVDNVSGSTLTFDDLSQTEQACASLGVAPEGFRPLGWLNAGHFDTLVKNNQMDDTLVRRLEAYKVVATRG